MQLACKEGSIPSMAPLLCLINRLRVMISTSFAYATQLACCGLPICSSKHCRAKCPTRQKSDNHGHTTCNNQHHKCTCANCQQKHYAYNPFKKHVQCRQKFPTESDNICTCNKHQNVLYLETQSMQHQQLQKVAWHDCQVTQQACTKNLCSRIGFKVKLTDACSNMSSRPAYRRAGAPEVAPLDVGRGKRFRRVAGIDDGHGRERTPPRPSQSQSPTLHMATLGDPNELKHMKIVSQQSRFMQRGMRNETLMDVPNCKSIFVDLRSVRNPEHSP